MITKEAMLVIPYQTQIEFHTTQNSKFTLVDHVKVASAKQWLASRFILVQENVCDLIEPKQSVDH